MIAPLQQVKMLEFFFKVCYLMILSVDEKI
jgi:hypothetical protein